MQRDYQLLKSRMNQKKVVEPRPGVFAPVDCWNKLGDRQRYLHVLRSMAAKHPDWVFCSFSAAVIQGLAVSKSSFAQSTSPLQPNSLRRGANWRGPLSSVSALGRHRQWTKTTPEVETVFCCAARGGFSEGLIVADSFCETTTWIAGSCTPSFYASEKTDPAKHVRSELLATPTEDQRTVGNRKRAP